jgi:hypothetical protein
VRYLVGDTIIAATWFFFACSGALNNLSTTGIRNASVFPLPVTASTTTSLFPMNSGIVDACTGVIFSKPMLESPSSIHCESGGLTEAHALGSFSGAAGGSDCAVVVAAASTLLAFTLRLEAATMFYVLRCGVEVRKLEAFLVGC